MYGNIWLFIVNFKFTLSFADVRYYDVTTAAGISDWYQIEKAVFWEVKKDLF